MKDQSLRASVEEVLLTDVVEEVVAEAKTQPEVQPLVEQLGEPRPTRTTTPTPGETAIRPTEAKDTRMDLQTMLANSIGAGAGAPIFAEK